MFKQYRESDGQFYFKLQAADGRLLLQSGAFASPKVAGQTIARLQTEGLAGLGSSAADLQLGPEANSADIDTALQAMREAKQA
jgi:tryptophanyl-tRNA synthetase